MPCQCLRWRSPEEHSATIIEVGCRMNSGPLGHLVASTIKIQSNECDRNLKMDHICEVMSASFTVAMAR